MRKRIISVLLAFTLLAGLLPATAAGVASTDGEYGWPEMQGDVAMRVTKDGAEVTRLIVGETYQLQFWLQNVGPYAITLPLCWDPGVVTVVDSRTGVPVTSGRKQEGEVTGFRAGSKCYESDYDPMTYESLYWNGQPVYSSGDVGEGGYPYLNAEAGCYRFFYYVSAPTPPMDAQMFLEVSFRVDAKGDPDFHIGSFLDGAGRFDPANPAGMSLLLPEGDNGAQETNYGTAVNCPKLRVLTPEEYRQEALTPEDPGGMFPAPDPKPNRHTGETPEVQVDLISSRHLDCFPYTTAAETAAVLKNIDGVITMESDYILPSNLITLAINTQRSKHSLLVRMPDEMIDKQEYALVFSLSSIDDMANREFSMLYIETPWAFVGLNTAILAAQTPDEAEARVAVRPYGAGLSLSMTVDGEPVKGFSGAALRIILPYSSDGETPGSIPIPMGRDVFGEGTGTTQPLSVYKLDRAHHAIIFLSPSFGECYIEHSTVTAFSDMEGAQWAEDAIADLTQRQILSGVGDGKFEPNGQVTREQFATMVVRAFGMYSAVGENRFRDVPEASGYRPYIVSAAEAGIVAGLSETEFGMGQRISRQDLAVLAYRALTALGAGLPAVREAPAFADDGQIADYAKEAVYTLYRANVLNGTEEDLFSPTAPATRAQAAKILHGVLNAIDELL